MHYNPNYQAIPGALTTRGDTNYLVTGVITTASYLTILGLTHTTRPSPRTQYPGAPQGLCEELNYEEALKAPFLSYANAARLVGLSVSRSCLVLSVCREGGGGGERCTCLFAVGRKGGRREDVPVCLS